MASLPEPLIAPATFGTVILAAISYFVITTFLSYRRLQHFPGPPLAAFSQLWFALATAKGDCYKTTKQVLEQYGTYMAAPPFDRAID